MADNIADNIAQYCSILLTNMADNIE